MKHPQLVEIIAEPGVGKTHLSLLFFNSQLLDLTERAESKPILEKLYPTDWQSRYTRIKEFPDIKKAVIKAHTDGRKTIVIDTGSHLRLLGGADYLKELKKDKPSRERISPTEWSHVNEAVADFLSKAMEEYEMNVVITAQMKDEWKKSEDGSMKPTGRRERAGYSHMDSMADIRLYLKIDDNKVGDVVTKIRKCIVVKNRYKDITHQEWIPLIELGHDIEPDKMISYRKIMEITGFPEETWVK